jgi:hypothetical protein
MEKLIREHENGTVITNPEDRLRTVLRKLVYRLAVTVDWIQRLFRRDSATSRRR